LVPQELGFGDFSRERLNCELAVAELEARHGR
jgi:hypothetical protein